jgi:hypothetical protein
MNVGQAEEWAASLLAVCGHGRPEALEVVLLLLRAHQSEQKYLTVNCKPEQRPTGTGTLPTGP